MTVGDYGRLLEKDCVCSEEDYGKDRTEDCAEELITILVYIAEDDSGSKGINTQSGI